MGIKISYRILIERKSKMIKTVRLSQIYVASYEEAFVIKDKINNGESFEALQETYGLPGSHDIGFFTIGEGNPIPDSFCALTTPVQISVMGLEVNEIGEPIEIELQGWVIMKRLA